MDDYGYTIIPDVLPGSELDGILAAVAACPDRTRAGARHLLRNSPVIAAMARKSRLVDIASEILGRTALPFKATFFDKSSASNWLVGWHQDTALPLKQRRETPGWGPWSVKAGLLYARAPASALEQIIALRIHLDYSTAENGPLRVLPGSHRFGVLTDAQIADLKPSNPVDCVVDAGGVIAMRPLIVHASSKSVSAAPRRVIHVEYAASLEFDGLELALA